MVIEFVSILNFYSN